MRRSGRETTLRAVAPYRWEPIISPSFALAGHALHFQSQEQWTESPGWASSPTIEFAAPQWRHQIVVSDYVVPQLMQRAAANGAFACLCKPVAADELAQVVAEARGRADLR